jgi:ribulose-phosphate 3-epimerase
VTPPDATAPGRSVRRARIAVSILSADFAALGDAVRAAERGGADLFHIDVMDGHFVPPITMGPIVVEALRRVTSLPLDVHLMVEAPERQIEMFAHAGASSIAFHVEATPHPHRVLEQIRGLGARAGLAINPGTPAEAAGELVEVLDFGLVMSVNPGYSGQAFIPAVLSKVGQLRRLLDGRPAWITIDGGINSLTAPRAVAAGADILVASSAIFDAPEGIEAAVASLRRVVQP